jgi:urocanate hydratase
MFPEQTPYRETSNIYDGSRFTADMAIQNVIGDSSVALLGYPFTYGVGWER